MNWKVAALSLLLGAFLTTGCSDNDIPKTEMALKLSMPEALDGVKDLNIKKGSVTFTNKSSGLKTVQDLVTHTNTQVNLLDGAYDVLVEGVVSYSVSVQEVEKIEGENVVTKVSKTIEKTIRGFRENVIAANGTANLNMNVFLFDESAGFVISELFYAGYKSSETQKKYRQASYFEIYNNSNEVLYADGLAIGETAFNTDFARLNSKLTPDDRITNTAIHAFYRIPGNGRQYPVKPGQTLVICDIPDDHSKNFTGAVNLSEADFEWYDDNEILPDADVAEVSNMEKVYCYTRTIWQPNAQGVNAYVLFKLDKTKQNFLDENLQTYNYHFSFNGFEREITKNYYYVPNSSIIDAVELSNETKFTWKILSPELDLSWTNSGYVDDSRFGKSIVRKVSHQSELGHPVLLDTNNSGFDFVINDKPNPGVI